MKPHFASERMPNALFWHTLRRGAERRLQGVTSCPEMHRSSSAVLAALAATQ